MMTPAALLPRRCRSDFWKTSRDWRATVAGRGHIWSPVKETHSLYPYGVARHANYAMQILTDVSTSTTMEIRSNKHISVAEKIC